eukprot:3668002-Amphidinium_carterae.1
MVRSAVLLVCVVVLRAHYDTIFGVRAVRQQICFPVADHFRELVLEAGWSATLSLPGALILFSRRQCVRTWHFQCRGAGAAAHPLFRTHRRSDAAVASLWISWTGVPGRLQLCWCTVPIMASTQRVAPNRRERTCADVGFRLRCAAGARVGGCSGVQGAFLCLPCSGYTRKRWQELARACRTEKSSSAAWFSSCGCIGMCRWSYFARLLHQLAYVSAGAVAKELPPHSCARMVPRQRGKMSNHDRCLRRVGPDALPLDRSKAPC